jgi:hypothetical protein
MQFASNTLFKTIREGATTATDVIQILDSDLCLGNKCLKSNAQDKMLKTLNTSIYDNNLILDPIDLKSIGLSSSDLPFSMDDLNDAVFSIEYQYGSGRSSSGSGSGSKKTYDLSFNYGTSINLANYLYGPLQIKDADYCYTDISDGVVGVTDPPQGKRYCIDKNDLLKKLPKMVKNNQLTIDVVNPESLGTKNPYNLVPNSENVKPSSENEFRISYKYGNYPAVKDAIFDGAKFQTKTPG